jgi:hypothetical protein
MSASVSTTKSKRATSKPVSSEGAEPAGEAPSSTRRTKKRKVLREVDDSDDEFPEITKLPLKATRGANTALQADTAIDDGHTPMAEANALDGNELPEAPAEPPKAPAKGKRGRKKKEPAASSAEQPPVVPEPEPTALPPSEPPAKKKRGRPRKSETTNKPAEVVEQPAPAAEEEHNRGAENLTEDVQEAPVQALTELEHNSHPEPVVPDKETPVGNERGNDKENSGSEAPASKDKANDEAKEKNKETPKTTTTSTLGKTIGKVQYRVGLSRMSRIAPLLKVIKKPT